MSDKRVLMSADLDAPNVKRNGVGDYTIYWRPKWQRIISRLLTWLKRMQD